MALWEVTMKVREPLRAQESHTAARFLGLDAAVVRVGDAAAAAADVSVRVRLVWHC